jgi:TolA-binding protein
MVTHLMSPHLTQEMRDNLASDAFLALPAPAQSATIVAYAQAIETAAAAAQERESIKNKDFINNSAHQQVTLQNTVVRLEGDVERLGAERLKMLERAVAAETERDLLKAHVRKIYDSRASNRAGPLQDPEAETSLVAAPAAEAASPKCQASEPPDGAGSPTYARLLEKARRGYLEASVLMQEARHVEWFTNRPL